MNTKDYTSLLNKPYSLNERQTAELETLLSEFPFLQSARAIYLKGLYNQDSFRYNTELKKTAAYTTDRSLLFDFITSEQFQSVDATAFIENEKALQSINVNDSEVLETENESIYIPEPEPIYIHIPVPVVNKLEESIKQSIKAVEELKPIDPPTTDTDTKLEESIKRSIQAVEGAQEPQTEIPVTELVTGVEQVIQPEPEASETIIEETEQKLEIGKPLEFNSSETHSFAEWLKLSKLTPINREGEVKKEPESEEKTPEISETISKKMELIDKFIETNPKIAPVKNSTPSPVNIERSTTDNSMLMTETLARVYLEQKKYSKAIQAYQILILKYPEKSVFFADRILDIKILQQNNN